MSITDTNSQESKRIRFRQHLNVYSKRIPTCTRMIKGLKSIRILVGVLYPPLMAIIIYSSEISTENTAGYDVLGYLTVSGFLMIVYATRVIDKFRKMRIDLEGYVETCESVLQSDTMDEIILKDMDEFNKSLRKPMQFVLNPLSRE